jgi:hypothetical protein
MSGTGAAYMPTAVMRSSTKQPQGQIADEENAVSTASIDDDEPIPPYPQSGDEPPHLWGYSAV